MVTVSISSLSRASNVCLTFRLKLPTVKCAQRENPKQCPYNH